MVALHATVHNGPVTLLGDSLLVNLWVYPVGEAPLLWRYLSKLHRTTDVAQNSLSERLVEISVVEEDVWVVKPPVEVSLERLDRLYDTV
jgi:hypothetical protein